VTRARLGAQARAPRRRTFAEARLQVCANVFAQSRIHFDARLALNAAAGATDCAAASQRRCVANDDDDGIEMPARVAGPSEIITH